MTESLKRQMDLEEELLKLINRRDEFTRSDLQGAVSAFVMKNCKTS